MNFRVATIMVATLKLPFSKLHKAAQQAALKFILGVGG
jgi:hypothetical protein